MSWINLCFLTYLVAMLRGGNAVMTDSSKSCGRLGKVTVPIRIVFFVRPWL